MATDIPFLAPERLNDLRSSPDNMRSFLGIRRLLCMSFPLLLDLGCVSLACIAGILLYHVRHTLYGRSTGLLWAELSFNYGLAFVILARAHQLYAQCQTLLQVANTARVISVSVYSLALLSVGSYFIKAEIPRLLMAEFWILATLLLVAQKYVTGRMSRNWSFSVSHMRRVLLCGTSRETRRLFSHLLHSPGLGRIPIGFLDETGFDNRRVIYSHDYSLKDHAPVICEPLSHSLLQALDVTEIFIPSMESQSRMNELMTLAADAKVSVSLVGAGAGAGHPHFGECCTAVQMMDGLMVTTFDADAELPVGYTILKRTTDLVLSALLILLTLPVWFIIAVMVKATSDGPVFFRQERTGQFGVKFVMLKFRSMYQDTPKYARSPEGSEDKRVTPIGTLLRKTSLDELPQLLNILSGDMSLVGPRPEMPYVTDTYTPLERRRLSVPQGLTGLWQLSGDRRFRIHEALEYDLYYIENRRISLDFAILLHTLFFAMKGL